MSIIYLQFIYCVRVHHCLNQFFSKHVSQTKTRKSKRVCSDELSLVLTLHLETPLRRLHISIFKAVKSFRKETGIIAGNLVFPKLLGLLNPLTIPWLHTENATGKRGIVASLVALSQFCFSSPLS